MKVLAVAGNDYNAKRSFPIPKTRSNSFVISNTSGSNGVVSAAAKLVFNDADDDFGGRLQQAAPLQQPPPLPPKTERPPLPPKQRIR